MYKTHLYKHKGNQKGWSENWKKENQTENHGKQSSSRMSEEERLDGQLGSDSQLATARSQLRFQSAAFSSSLQTAEQTLLDQNNKAM